jgi:hypothetical protein
MAKRKETEVYSRSEFSRDERLIDDAAEEAAAWANVSGIARNALSFWNTFIGLQSGANPLDPNGTGIAQLTCLIRAVSWVESGHGTGTGASAAKDPMQCANPDDSWWKELINCAVQQDRFVCGVGKPNFNACELPAKAAGDQTFPAQAKLSVLNDQSTGHSDGNFNRTMSYYWGVPFLIHKTNGNPTYQCGSLTRSRMVAGAVAYNGHGDEQYKDKINHALDMIGCVQSGPITDFWLPSGATDTAHAGAASAAVRAMMQEIESLMGKSNEQGRSSLFFPNGIELIDLSVQVGGVKIELKVAGPKAS